MTIIDESCTFCCPQKRYSCTKSGCIEYRGGHYLSYEECVDDFLSNNCFDIAYPPPPPPPEVPPPPPPEVPPPPPPEVPPPPPPEVPPPPPPEVPPPPPPEVPPPPPPEVPPPPPPEVPPPKTCADYGLNEDCCPEGYYPAEDPELPSGFPTLCCPDSGVGPCQDYSP